MATVFVTQLPHRRDPATGTFVPILNIMPATEHGVVRVLFPPRAPFVHIPDLLDQLRQAFMLYDVKAGDCLLTLGDPIIAAAACAILGAKPGGFTVLRWDKNLGRYTKALVVVL